MVYIDPSTQPTHQYTNSNGHISLCIPWTHDTVIMMCNDQKTWMPEPVWVGSGGIHLIRS